MKRNVRVLIFEILIDKTRFRENIFSQFIEQEDILPCGLSLHSRYWASILDTFLNLLLS